MVAKNLFSVGGQGGSVKRLAPFFHEPPFAKPSILIKFSAGNLQFTNS